MTINDTLLAEVGIGPAAVVIDGCRLTLQDIANVARDKFEVAALFAPQFKDDVTSRYIAAHSETHHVLPVHQVVVRAAFRAGPL